MKEFYYATVIDNNDPDKKGRVKIKVPFLHEETTDDLLPWAKAFPLSTGGSSTHGTSCIPEIDSLLWVGFADQINFKKPYYIADIHLNDMNPHGLFEANVKSQLEGFTSEYPDVKFTYLPNGICVGYTSGDNAEAFFVHPKASIYIDKDGKTTFKDTNENQITIDTNGIDIVDKSGNEIAMTSTGIDIKDKNSCEVQMTASGITIKASGKQITVNGTVAPTGSGPWCGIPACLFTGAPHVGSAVTGS